MFYLKRGSCRIRQFHISRCTTLDHKMVTKYISLVFKSIFAIIIASTLHSSVLKPIKLESPKDTMKTFIEAMDEYREGIEESNEEKQDRINDAVRTLNLDEIAPLLKQKVGKESAIFLKEVIDRIIVIDYSKIPDESVKNLNRWRLKDTDITIVQIKEGDEEGNYLFSKNTVKNAKRYYQKVKHLPYLENSGMGALYSKPINEKLVPDWSKQKLGPLFLWQWIGLMISFIISMAVFYLAKLLLTLFQTITKKTKNLLDDLIIKGVKNSFSKSIALIFLIINIRILQIEGLTLQILTITAQAILSFYLIKLFYKLTEVLLDSFLDKFTKSKFDSQFIYLFKRVIKFLVIVLGSLVAVQNLGINVMGVMAGLGLGGLAFALAAKDTCANVFGSITIFLDKPFEVGDWVISKDIEGTIESIGFRSTKVRTFYNSLVSIPNALLATSNIDNMGKRKFRRMKHFYTVTYDTPAEAVKDFVHGIRQIILDHPRTTEEFHVTVHSMKDSGIDIMLYCFLKSKDWDEELKDKQDIHLKIASLAENKNIKFSFDYFNNLKVR